MVQNFDNRRRSLTYSCIAEASERGLRRALDARKLRGTTTGIYGVMWRAADITTHVNASGTVLCDATGVTDRAISIDDATF